jgi:hypothetical protein
MRYYRKELFLSLFLIAFALPFGIIFSALLVGAKMNGAPIPWWSTAIPLGINYLYSNFLGSILTRIEDLEKHISALTQELTQEKETLFIKMTEVLQKGDYRGPSKQ